MCRFGSPDSLKPSLIDLHVLPHTVHEFGVEARKAGKAWEAAFNGPIQSWADAETGQTTYGVTVRLSRIKDPLRASCTRPTSCSTCPKTQMHGMHNVYDMARRFPFTRIRGPRTPVPHCPPRAGKLWYDANPEGVIMEDVRQAPATLPDGRPGFFVTGQGYRGKVMLPDGLFIHDVGVYGGYLDPQERPAQLELQHLFGGIEFVPRQDRHAGRPISDRTGRGRVGEGDRRQRRGRAARRVLQELRAPALRRMATRS